MHLERALTSPWSILSKLRHTFAQRIGQSMYAPIKVLSPLLKQIMFLALSGCGQSETIVPIVPVESQSDRIMSQQSSQLTLQLQMIVLI